MEKVRLFVNRDMTVIDMKQDDTYANFHSFDRDVVIANVIKIEEVKDRYGTTYNIYTDFRNPYRSICSCFSLNSENFAKVNWIED